VLLVPITELITSDQWPADYVPAGGASVDSALAKVYFTDYRTLLSDAALGFEATIVFLEEIAIAIPGLGGMSLVFGAAAGAGTAACRLEAHFGKDGWSLRANDIEIALRFPPDILRPVPPADGGETPAYVQASVRGMLSIDHTSSLRYEGFDQISLPTAIIGNSGVTISAKDVRLEFSRTATPPDVIAAGFDESFVGVIIGEAHVTLPEHVSVATPEGLILRNAAIGSGGVSGGVEAHYTPVYDAATRTFVGPGAGTLFGTSFGLRRLLLEFRQNAIVASRLQGELLLPFFDQPVAVDLSLGVNGDFTATLSAVQPPGVSRTDDGLIEFEKPGILKLTIDSLGFKKHGGDVWITLSGAIKLLYGGLDWPEVEVRELSIDQHGHIHIDGGWLDLPSSKTLDFNGFMMELTKIGFGNDANRKWIGFSGAVRLADELAFGASVEGLKVLWDGGGHVDLQMSSIRVELEIPDVLGFEGFVEYFAEGTTKGFKGDIALVLHSLDISFDARLVVGKNRQSPPYNFFYILVDAGLPAGIPLGQSNLALYGFAALMANNMTPTRTADQPWFQWYLLPPIGTTDTDKWVDVRGRQALGAGVTLGTAADDGFAFSAKAILIVLLPGPLLLIDGKANMLKPRKELAGQAQGDHRALAVFDRRAGTFLLNIQPRFKYDEYTGAMLDVIGAAEVFFDFSRPNAWHLYLGEDNPLEKRIRAKVFKGLLKADSFLMLDHPGMRVGARAGFDEDYKFGPLRVALKAQIDGEADVSWRPTQAEGTLRLEGMASLRAFGCKASASVQARLDVETPKPFHVEGSFRVKLKTPWPLRDPTARVRLEWGNPDEETEQEETVARVAAEHLKVTDTWDLERTAWQSPQSISAGVPTIPLDSKMLINFNRPVADRALVGCNAAPSPPRERVGRVEVLHELIGIKLSRAQHSGWVSVEERVDGAGDLYGMWLPLPGGLRAAGKLQLWSGSPFAYTRNTGRSYADWFLAEHPSYPRVPQAPAEQVRVNFDAVKLRRFPALFVVEDLIFEYLFSAAEMQPRLETYDSAWRGTKHALVVTDAATVDGRIPLRITVPESASEVRVFANGDRPTSLRAFRDGQEVANSPTAAAGNVELIVRAAAIDYVELAPTGPDTRGHIRVLEVCFMTQAERNRVDEAQRVDNHLTKEMAPETARWCGEGHVLEPDTLYQLEIGTRIRTWRDGEEDAGEPPLYEYVYFRTAGPPGFFSDEGRLRDLMPYVASHLSSPPNGARDVYRDYDVRLVFSENYLERMYDGMSRALGVALFDRNGPAVDELGQLVPTSVVWSRGPEAVTSDTDRLWRWSVSRALSNGSGDIAGCGAPPSILEARLDGRPLAPRALIEARTIVAGRPDPIHRTSFVTSRFATFVHHVHSFRDFAWDHPLPTPEDVARVGAIVTAVRDAGPDFHAETEGPLFEELSSLFGLGQRPLPDRIEIAVLRDDDQSYALLLESPQPIEWSRTSLSVRSAPDAGPRTAATGPVKIIGARLRQSDMSGTDFNAESLDLLIESDADISGFSVEYTGGGGGSTMISYWTCGVEPVLPAGTVLRIHAGAHPLEEAATPECLHRYATPAGEGGRWRLNEAGDTVRLVDAAGVERQRWTVMPSSQFQAMTPILVRSADETRAFVFFPESEAVPVGRVPEGRIRMEWRFMRDIGPFAPVMSRRGRRDPEEATLEFSLPAPAIP
jgi:hypothetical protein